MDIQQLKLFISVAQTLNFSESARRNDVAQSSISRNISELEKKLGCRLLDRTKWEVKLTEEGKLFLPYAIETVQTLEKGASLLRQYQSGRLGHISIAALSTSSPFLVACLSQFSRKCPDVMVDVEHNTVREQLLALDSSLYDFYFLHSGMRKDMGGMEYLTTHQDRLVMVLPKGHPKAEGEVKLQDLEREHFIMLSEAVSSQYYEQVIKLCAQAGYTPKIVNCYSKLESVLLAVSAGMGVSILPSSLAKMFLPLTTVIKPIDSPDAVRTYLAAWDPRRLSPSAQTFLEVVRRMAEGGDRAWREELHL